jgi:hypothetical protein
MKKLGISVYPGSAQLEQNIEYIALASKYGFERIFTCLISIENQNAEDTIKDFKKMVSFANSKGLIVIADIDHSVFKRYNLTINDLSFFKELGVYGIRLDLGFSGIEESFMTFNPYGIKIELNMSNGNRYIENILSYKPNKENLLSCHNFYPHLYTGLSLEHFIKCSRQYTDLGIRTAAFINSQNATFGQWPVSEGICTLEMHRNMSIETQAKHLFATGLIDDVIIANAFASEKELKSLNNLNKDMLEFTVETLPNIPELEKKILFEEIHFNRGDVSEYVARSTQSRVKYKSYEFPLFNPSDIKRGDILIDSSLYTRYAGELQIALKDMRNTGKTNVIGRIIHDELFLLDYLEPWMKFGFTQK